MEDFLIGVIAFLGIICLAVIITILPAIIISVILGWLGFNICWWHIWLILGLIRILKKLIFG